MNAVILPELLPAGEWLKHYLSRVNRIGISAESPLYAYRTEDAEYDELIDVLKLDVRRDRIGWAAGFCLFVAEYYRREYEGGWGWELPVANRLGLDLERNECADLTRRGLELYWKRSLRRTSNETQYLGSLFAEGGVPWRQVVNNNHGFGRAIRGGLRHWQQGQAGHVYLVDAIARYGDCLPKAFRNTHTYRLLADIVSELMALARGIPELADSSDPVALLDKRQPTWRRRFPVPLSEKNGRTVVSHWLVDAGRENRGREASHISETQVKTELIVTESTWGLSARITLAEEISVDIDEHLVTTPRIVLEAWEGKYPIRALARDHAKPEKGEITLKPTVLEHFVDRCRLEEPLLLRVVCGGITLATLELEPARTVDDAQPLIFESIDDRWQLCGTESVKVQGDVARVMLPPGTTLAGKPRHTDAYIGRGTWIDLYENATVDTANGPVVITLGASEANGRITVCGNPIEFQTRPLNVFQGWPVLEIPSGAGYTLSELEYRLDGNLVTNTTLQKFVGVADLCIRHSQMGLLLRRRFGVLPKDLTIKTRAPDRKNPAMITLRSICKLTVQSASTNVSKLRIITDGAETKVFFDYEGAANAIELDVSDGESRTRAVRVRIIVPAFAAQLLDENDRPMAADGSVFELDRLHGRVLVLGNQALGAQNFNIILQPLGASVPSIKRERNYTVEGKPLEVPLNAFRDDIALLLSACPLGLDRVRIEVWTNQVLVRCEVRRFAAQLSFEANSKQLRLDTLTDASCPDSATLLALDFSNPARAVVPIHSRSSEGVPTGVFDLPECLSEGGPYLVHSARDAAIRVRPTVIGISGSETRPGQPTTLAEACVTTDFKQRSKQLDEIVAAMGDDLEHPSWDYLRALREQYSHLPLAMFDAWQCLARNHKALVLYFMKYGSADALQSGRFENELAFVWDEIPLEAWYSALFRFRTYLAERAGFEREDVRDYVNRALINVPAGIRALHVNKLFDAVEDHTEDQDVQILQHFFNEMRQRHSSSTHNWPCGLQFELEKWAQEHSLLGARVARRKGTPRFAYCSYLMPLFMGEVTAGVSTFDCLELGECEIRFHVQVYEEFDPEWYKLAHFIALRAILKE